MLRNIVLMICVMSAVVATEIKSNKQIFKGEVISIIDGDNVVIRINSYEMDSGKEIPIRIYGIDAPELRQRYGKTAKRYLARWILGRNVEVHLEEFDNLGKAHATVYFKNIDVGKIMVQKGLAWAYRQYSSKYTQDEVNARQLKIGIWSKDNPIEPREYRRYDK